MANPHKSRGQAPAAHSRTPDLGDTYLSSDQIAAQLGGRLSARAIRQRAKEGLIPAASFGHGRQRRWLFPSGVIATLEAELGGAE